MHGSLDKIQSPCAPCMTSILLSSPTLPFSHYDFSFHLFCLYLSHTRPIHLRRLTCAVAMLVGDFGGLSPASLLVDYQPIATPNITDIISDHHMDSYRNSHHLRGPSHRYPFPCPSQPIRRYRLRLCRHGYAHLHSWHLHEDHANYV